ncbi:hypothetical protein AB0K60_34090 [Thermopolyspora sp. NPDC052614]|uniref:hypothetical protein n=1 Tax=Thermopolyspora sp. NPDC052614 TaxID=3155682 RepID=UPI003441A0C8
MLRRLLIASACAGAVFLTPVAVQADSPEPTDSHWLVDLTGPDSDESDDRPSDPISRLLGRLLGSFG